MQYIIWMKISYWLPNFYFQGMPKAIEEGARYCPAGKNKHTQTQNSEETTNKKPLCPEPHLTESSQTCTTDLMKPGCNPK